VLPGRVPAGQRGPEGTVTAAIELDQSVALHELTYLDEGDEVVVGRPDIESYAVLPRDGAELLRRLAGGETPRSAATWYESEYHEPLDVADFLATIGELGFIRAQGEAVVARAPVRWTRLGRAVFSPVAGAVLVGLVTLALIAIVRRPALVPDYRDVFFTRSLVVIELVAFLGQIPLLFLHEAAHALAGRRLGLPTRLGIGRRLYYVVFETTMDSLVSVPRRRRYLPMLAGMLADLAAVSVLLLVAAATETAAGGLTTVGRIALALAFTTLLRITWQFWFYLQTDLYYVVVTTLGCVDLQRTAKQLLRNKLNRLIGRTTHLVDESDWHARDAAVARWYAWLLLVGYATSITTLLLVGIPAARRMVELVVTSLNGSTHDAGHVWDSVVFLSLNLIQIVVLAWVAVRDRRRRHGPVPS
jgi:hypothetical protein